jgi:hypothetical protein
MTFDVIGLLIFLLAIVPGFIAQQARSLLVPRSLRTKSVLEETGNYVFNSIVVHLVLLGSSRVAFVVFHGEIPASLGAAIAQKQLPDCGSGCPVISAPSFLGNNRFIQLMT